MEKTDFKKSWVYHSEWFGLMATIIGCFLFVHREAVHVNERLDNHIAAINSRCDAINERGDDLHREFYELLKEMRKSSSGK